ncbi:ABC transporter permease [Roseiflexus sp.]|uniref:ABC transporter permease n=1 Tax=Roseiflexus sp. TaxID=2562120 RepID=UPI0021DD7CAC|nr:ABC transporter permease [Roseiflexus sp.]GIW01577.1 MAG: carnitine transport permease OpuCB [Roseiflexus sp.]
MIDLLLDAYQYFLANQSRFWTAATQHLWISSAALAISIAAGLPLGIWTAHKARIGQWTINLFGALRLAPSLAVLFLVQPYLGIGTMPALVALTLLAVPPVLIATYAGIRAVDRGVSEAARGMGMTAGQILWRVELPLALPSIVGGVRTAAVEVIASATLAAFIGGGGLGIFITRGYALFDTRIMLVGAIPVALLALMAELSLGWMQRRLASGLDAAT